MTFEADVGYLSGLVPGLGVSTEHIELTGATLGAASAFDVDRLLAASAGYCVASADHMSASPERHIGARTLELDHVLSSCTTHVEVDGDAVPAWADLSGVYPTADGRFLQIHCNFPHHAAGVVELLATSDDRHAVGAAIASRNAIELETELVAAGMIGAAVRTLDEWDAHPHARATRDLPVLSVEPIGEADPAGTSTPSALRVLDCSRVLAGPVAGQMFAGFGAQVIRVGAAHLPSVPAGVMSTGFGKRNVDIDLRTDDGHRTMSALMQRADVWIDAFRPGAMSRHGFTPERAAALRPGIVIVQISAFDWIGPWAGRRGFDSIVQSTTGIRWAGGASAVDAAGSPTGRGPTGLPVQALDYATGFLAAGVGSQLVAHRRSAGGSWLARLSLLRTRNWLASMGGPDPYQPATLRAHEGHLATVDSEFGRITAVTPFAGEWHGAPRRLGTSDPNW